MMKNLDSSFHSQVYFLSYILSTNCAEPNDNALICLRAMSFIIIIIIIIFNCLFGCWELSKIL